MFIDAVDRFLNWVPDEGFLCDSGAGQITGKQLHRLAREGAHTTGGPDGWQCSHMTLLPTAWYDELAALCNAIVERGLPLPKAWVHVRVAMIPKPEDVQAP